MSLLLDALKRAAQEKLEKQRQDEGTVPGTAASADEALSLDITDAPHEIDDSHDNRDLKLESGTDLRIHRADVLASELQAFMGASTTEQQTTRAAKEIPERSEPPRARQPLELPAAVVAVTATPAAAARVFRNKRSGMGSQPILLIGGGVTVLLLVAVFYAVHLNSLNQSNVRVDRLLAAAQAPAAVVTQTPADTPAPGKDLLAEQEGIDTLPGAAPGAQAPAGDTGTVQAAPTNLFASNPAPAGQHPVKEGDGNPSLAERHPTPNESAQTPVPRLRVKKNNQEPLHGILLRSYNAYQSGDIAAAEAGYRQALARAPENRDALLGFAATAIQKGDYAAAMESYATLLDLDPNDDLALAGISGLKQDVQGTTDESLIRRLLLKRPESPQLHFALGNVYSAAADWPKAQSAYFDAHRHDSQNPDYAYNLAVSLEHLRQPETALRYYQLALNLAGARKPNFDLAQAGERISVLQAYAEAAAPDAR